MQKNYYLPEEEMPEDIKELIQIFSGKTKPVTAIQTKENNQKSDAQRIIFKTKLLYKWGWSPILCKGKRPLMKEWTELGEDHSAELIDAQNIDWQLNKGADSIAIYLGDEITDIDIEFECFDAIYGLRDAYDFIQKAPIIRTNRGIRIIVRCDDSRNITAKNHTWEVRSGKKCSHVFGPGYSFIQNDITDNFWSPNVVPLVTIDQIERFLFDLDIAVNGELIYADNSYSKWLEGLELKEDTWKLFSSPDLETISGTTTSGTTTSNTTTSGTTTSPEKGISEVVVLNTQENPATELLLIANDHYDWRKNILSNHQLARQIFIKHYIEIPDNPDQYFLCPFHPENHASVTWSFDGRTGRWIFHDYHNHTEETKFDLVECYAGLETGDLRRFDANDADGKKDFNLWLSRMAIEFNQLPYQASVVKNQIDTYVNYLDKLPVLSKNSKSTLKEVLIELGREFIEGACTGRPYAGMSVRYLSERTKMPVKKASQAINYICCMGIISKTHSKSNQIARIPDRFILNMDVSPEYLSTIVELLDINSLKQLNQNMVAQKLGPQIAASIFRRQSAAFEKNNELPSWHPERVLPDVLSGHDVGYLH